MSGSRSNVAPSRELLLANHTFPGDYTIKAFGPKSAEFETAVVEAATILLGAARVRSAVRASSQGRRICVTLELSLETVDEVIRVYERIYEIPKLMLIL